MDPLDRCMYCGEEMIPEVFHDPGSINLCKECSKDIEMTLNPRQEIELKPGDRVRVYMSDPVRGVAVRSATVELPGQGVSARKNEPVAFVALDEPIATLDPEGELFECDRLWVHRKQVRRLRKRG